MYTEPSKQPERQMSPDQFLATFLSTPQALDRSIITSFFPAFANTFGVSQDQRWHAGINVFEHLLQAHRTVLLHPDFQEITSERLRQLTLIVSLFHDIAKTKENRQQGEIENNGTGREVAFIPIQFSAHAQASERIFATEFIPFNQRLTNPFSREELNCARLWIKHHDRLMQFSRGESNPKTSLRFIQRTLTTLCPKYLTNGSIEEAMEVFKACLLIQQIEILTSNPEANLESHNQPRWQPWRKLWEEMHDKSAVIRSQCLTEFPVYFKNGQEAVIAPLIGHNDWENLGITAIDRSDIFLQIREAQLSGTIATRFEALSRACELAGIQKTPAAIRAIANSSRAYRGLSGRVTGKEIKSREDIGDGAYMIRYIARPISEFPENTPEEQVRDRINSGNYPLIKKWLEVAGLENPYGQVKTILHNKKFYSLQALEIYLESHTTDPRNLVDGFLPNETMLSIRRSDHSSLEVQFGFQSDSLHIGSGFFHFQETRKRDLETYFKNPSEQLRDMMDRFLREAVAHTFIYPGFDFPSHYDPDRFKVIVGKVSGKENLYLSLPVDCSKGEHDLRLMTVLFHTKQSDLRRDVKSKLGKLLEAGVDINSILSKVNHFFQKEGIKPLFYLDNKIN